MFEKTIICQYFFFIYTNLCGGLCRAMRLHRIPMVRSMASFESSTARSYAEQGDIAIFYFVVKDAISLYSA